ncbi:MULTISPECIES: DUF397 domain-containing protein [Micromonospora]|uniref:DUF397 domain-containing protein n=1 Tax=Micromonospora solifontis TaxID=2487138 RepID=A0ABX9WI84_9ACTN|nr:MULTISPECIES: DUF397 domain-containing protein [Micromonospora]NES16352.1 DUF397 domain-containing protein [Micromonospora sp. PPF5-17B]NES36202.1 DUF397 domain-containing protein [Micromonospora solifontis]NES57953.1 DUF397 domain-containing protein [Micromonospora sp. PPF5-6]RNL99792.1 DUF397 domain-containing protein [Micromonospora solifontis]
MTSLAPRWRKSIRSANEGNCVEVADNLPGVVLVRDSKDRSGPTLTFTSGAWRGFLTAVPGSGDLDPSRSR